TSVVCLFLSSRRRHTRSKRDWSSDVCSSDLISKSQSTSRRRRKSAPSSLHPCARKNNVRGLTISKKSCIIELSSCKARCCAPRKIGRASCRERGESGGDVGV